MRVGDLRVIYLIDDQGETVQIEAVGNRDDIYERMRRR